jgi:hypothetical protein
VAELGSVFEADEGGSRGPDLRVTVEVPRAALGATLRAPVPRRIAAEGDLVERAVVGDDDPDIVELHLPERLPEGAVLRLRGHGGVGKGEARAGDLLVVVELVERPPRPDETIVTSALAPRPGGDIVPLDINRWVLLLGFGLLVAGVTLAVLLGG